MTSVLARARLEDLLTETAAWGPSCPPKIVSAVALRALAREPPLHRLHSLTGGWPYTAPCTLMCGSTGRASTVISPVSGSRQCAWDRALIDIHTSIVKSHANDVRTKTPHNLTGMRLWSTARFVPETAAAAAAAFTVAAPAPRHRRAAAAAAHAARLALRRDDRCASDQPVS